MQQPHPTAFSQRWPVFAVLVRGPSMAPALRDGDCVLVWRSNVHSDQTRHRVHRGAVVVARFRSRPDLLVVKRAVRPVDGGWWVEGDNPQVADDSRRYGVADVVGPVVLRYWPVRRLRLFRSGGRRLGARPE